MNPREGRKPTVWLTTLTKIFIRPCLLSFLPSLCISALFPMPGLCHLNSRHIWYVWIIYTVVISPLSSHQTGTIIKHNAQVNSKPRRAALCVYTQTQLDPAACFRNALPDACCFQNLVSERYAALQRQSAVTTHLVKNELRLVMGFMTCVVSACVCLVKKYLG